MTHFDHGIPLLGLLLDDDPVEVVIVMEALADKEVAEHLPKVRVVRLVIKSTEVSY